MKCLLYSISEHRTSHSLYLLGADHMHVDRSESRELSSSRDLHVCRQVDEQIHACYAQTMSEWLGCEAIVRQRERESHAAALAKCSSGASLDSHLHRMLHRDSTISNEVRTAGLRDCQCERDRALGQPCR